MNKVFIENYRGFDIEFDTDNSKFQCIIIDGKEKESKSFDAVRKFVDDYKKENQNFKPFHVEPAPDSYLGMSRSKPLKVVGIRKDGRFIAETPDGTRVQISDYDLKHYMLKLEWNRELIAEIHKLASRLNYFKEEVRRREKDIIEKMNIVTLKEHKQTLL